jgi:hypothetical protein
MGLLYLLSLSAKEWSRNGKRAPFIDSSTTGFEDICHNATSKRQNTDMTEDLSSKLSHQSENKRD